MQQPAHQTDADVFRRLAHAVGDADLEAAWVAYEQARIAGLCHEGAWEIALGTAATDNIRRDTPLPPH